MTRWSALSLYPAWNADEVKNPHCVNSVIRLCTEMLIIRCTVNLNVTKCPTKSKCKTRVCNFGVSICIQVIFRLGLGFLMPLQGLY